MADGTTTYTVGTVVVATAGTWAKGETLTPRIIVGGVFLALSLSILQRQAPPVASRLAALIFLTSLFVYGPDLIEKLNIGGDETAPEKRRRAPDKATGPGTTFGVTPTVDV